MGGSDRMLATAPIVMADVFEIESAFSTPYKLSRAYGTLATTRALMVKLTDADGIEGWGEANPLQPFTAESLGEAARALQAILLPEVMRGAAPAPGHVDAKLDALLEGHWCAKGALSMALLDILGKRLAVPVSTLLGGSLRESLPVLCPMVYDVQQCASQDDQEFACNHHLSINSRIRLCQFPETEV